MRIIRQLLLILALFFTLIIYFQVTPSSPEIRYDAQFFLKNGYQFQGITPGFENSNFSSRIFSYIIIMLYFFITKKKIRERKDRVLFYLSLSGLITEVYNLINIHYIHGWTSVLHWDILIVILLLSRINQIAEKRLPNTGQ